MDAPKRPRTAKIVLIGDSGTGKSALHHRYMTNTFSREYQATLGCSYQAKTIVVDGVQMSLQLWDTAGQERFRSLAASFFRGADGCILACSSVDADSVEALATHFAQFKERCPVEDDDLATFCWAAVECKTDLETLIKPRRLEMVLNKLVPIPGNQLGESHPPSRTNSRAGSPELSRKPSHKRASVGVQGTPGLPDSAELATTPPNPAPGPSTPPAPTTSLISVGHPFSPPAKQKHHSLHSLQSQPSLASTFSSAHSGDVSNISIYHTPSSSLHHASTGSLTGSEHTIIPGSGTPSINSDDDPYAEDERGMEEFTFSARQESARFGIDPFLSSSPPHAPAHLGRLPDPKLVYSGGPSTVPFEVDAPQPPNGARPGVAAGAEEVCRDCPGDALGGEGGGQEHDYGKDGVPLFRTSAKTGEGVDALFEYVARRVVWRWRREEAQDVREGARGGGQEVIKVGADGKEKGRKGWKAACCA